MTSKDTRTESELRAARDLWTGRLADARRRADRDLIAGCRRNLNLVTRELARRNCKES